MTAPTPRLLPLLALGAFASQASIRLVDPLLPQLSREFGASISQLSDAITAFAIAYGLMQVVYGPMADRLGKLRVIAWATAAASVGSFACAAAAGVPSLIVLRALTGAACAALIPLAIAWIGDTVEYSQRQPVLARFLIGSTTGIVFGQVAAGVFADTIGWRASFVTPGVLFLVVSIALFSRLRDRSTESVSASQAGAAASPLAAFGQVLANGWARTVLALVAIEGALNFSALALLPSWLHERHGLSLWQSGMAAAGYGLGGLLYALSGAALLRRLGERGLAVGGSTLLCVGFLALGGGVWQVELAKGVLCGLGFFMMHNTLQTLGTQMLPQLRGTAIAAFALTLFLGQSAGVALAARASQWMGFETVKAACAIGLWLIGLLLALLLHRRARLHCAG